MNQTELFDIRMSDVSETSLLTLYCHAIESQSEDPIISDPKAVEIMRAVNQELSKSKNRLHKKMVKGKIDKRMVVHIAIRAKRYDEYVTEFLKSSPDGVVVNIGCGLDSRFFAYRQWKSTFSRTLVCPKWSNSRGDSLRRLVGIILFRLRCWTVTASSASSPTQREFYIG